MLGFVPFWVFYLIKITLFFFWVVGFGLKTGSASVPYKMVRVLFVMNLLFLFSNIILFGTVFMGGLLIPSLF